MSSVDWRSFYWRPLSAIASTVSNGWTSKSELLIERRADRTSFFRRIANKSSRTPSETIFVGVEVLASALAYIWAWICSNSIWPKIHWVLYFCSQRIKTNSSMTTVPVCLWVIVTDSLPQQCMRAFFNTLRMSVVKTSPAHRRCEKKGQREGRKKSLLWTSMTKMSHFPVLEYFFNRFPTVHIRTSLDDVHGVTSHKKGNSPV